MTVQNLPNTILNIVSLNSEMLKKLLFTNFFFSLLGDFLQDLKPLDYSPEPAKPKICNQENKF